MSTRTRLGVLVATAAMIAAVPLAGTAAAKTKDGCKVLKTADVSAAFGEEAGEGVPSPFKGFVYCEWTLPSGGIIALNGSSKVDAVSKKEFEENSKADTAEKVPGLKNSFFDGEGTITFIKGKSFVNLQYLGPLTDTATIKAALTKLAKKAAKRF